MYMTLKFEQSEFINFCNDRMGHWVDPHQTAPVGFFSLI